jgi:hypothetical protein
VLLVVWRAPALAVVVLGGCAGILIAL